MQRMHVVQREPGWEGTEQRVPEDALSVDTEQGSHPEALLRRVSPFPAQFLVSLACLRCRHRIPTGCGCSQRSRYPVSEPGTAVLQPGKAKGARSELVLGLPAQHRTQSPRTTRELLNLLIKPHFSVGDHGFTVY